MIRAELAMSRVGEGRVAYDHTNGQEARLRKKVGGKTYRNVKIKEQGPHDTSGYPVAADKVAVGTNEIK